VLARIHKIVFTQLAAAGHRGDATYTRLRGAWRFRCVKVAFAVAQDVLGVLVMLGVLLQTPKATGLGGTIGGGGDSGGGYRRRRGLEASLLRVTIIFILLFVAVSIVETYVGAH
jgi:protein translocase SecG subunit